MSVNIMFAMDLNMISIMDSNMTPGNSFRPYYLHHVGDNRDSYGSTEASAVPICFHIAHEQPIVIDSDLQDGLQATRIYSQVHDAQPFFDEVTFAIPVRNMVLEEFVIRGVIYRVGMGPELVASDEGSRRCHLVVASLFCIAGLACMVGCH